MKCITETLDEYLIKLSIDGITGLEVRYYSKGVVVIDRNGINVVFDVPYAKDDIQASFHKGVLTVRVQKDYLIIPIV